MPILNHKEFPMPDLTLIAATLQSLFTADATSLAAQAGLVRRNSKLTGPLLLLILVAGFIQHPTASYNILAQVAADYGLPITRQALQQRLTSPAVCFFHAIFQQSLQRFQDRCRLPIPLLTQFTAVYLLDSSQVALPASLINEYRGTGGDGPSAGLKWQVLWEVLAGNLQQVSAAPAKQSDHRYRDYLTQLAAGSLILFDLGYVALPALQQLVGRSIYFVCRWNPRLEAFALAGQPFDLRTQLAASSEQQLEFALRIGVRAQLPLRVVAFRLPPAISEQRRRRAKATERKRGFQYTAIYKTMLDWNVYLTNVGAEQLDREQIRLVYGLRWQVELLFKLWKSEAQLANVRGKERGRVLCELYAKLIGLAIFGYLSAAVRLGDEELSVVQAWQVLRRQIEKVALAICGRRELGPVLALLYQRWRQFAYKERRATRPTTLGELQQQIVKSLT
jgi:hypothetical protein